MGTIFRIGMKVYDQIYEPDVKGEVLDVNMQISPHPITVKFGSCVRYYTAEGCRGRNQIRTLSTSPYRIENFEQKSPAKTYEEALEWLEKNSKDRVIYADEAYVSEEYEFAFEALKKLIVLRDYYNEGCQPDYSGKGDWKFCIVNYADILSKNTTLNISKVMIFKTEEIRDKFFEEQKELLKIAKPLL